MQMAPRTKASGPAMARASKATPNKKTGERLPATKGDALNAEVSIRAHLDHSGLTLGGKSRFLSATDRLFGGLVGIPAAYFEGIRVRTELKSDFKTTNLSSELNAVRRLLESHGEIGEAAGRRFVAEEIRKQQNREAVWAQAIAVTEELPSPDPNPGNGTADDTVALDDDWMDMFAGYAEKASSERVRNLWGRILSGEIRKPRSFALSTLRVLSEMDTEIANAFQDVLEHRISHEVILKSIGLHNDNLDKLIFLEEVGLLQEVNTELDYIVGLSADGIGWIFTSGHGLLIKTKAGSEPLHIRSIKITRVGQQIASILPWDELESLRRAASAVEHHVNVAGLELARIHDRSDRTFRYETIEVLHPRDEPTGQ
jgi:hypothetical protein